MAADQKQNASRRIVFVSTRRYEVPVDEAKLMQYLGEDAADINDQIIQRGIEEAILSGDTDVKSLVGHLTADPEHQDYLGESDITAEIEVVCAKHPGYWYAPNDKMGCIRCWMDERDAKDRGDPPK